MSKIFRLHSSDAVNPEWNKSGVELMELGEGGAVPFVESGVALVEVDERAFSLAPMRSCYGRGQGSFAWRPFSIERKIKNPPGQVPTGFGWIGRGYC